jgi:conjugal transfer pilus assembly protein TraU
MLAILLGASVSVMAGGIQRDMRCPNAHILGAGLFTKVCWACMFPVKLFGIEVFRGDNTAPDHSADRPFCACNFNFKTGAPAVIGTTLGMWMPTRIVELVRRPYCFPAMGGIQVASSATTMGGEMQTGYAQHSTIGTGEEYMDFFNVHYYAFQLFAILELLDMPRCTARGFNSFDLMFMGEAFPNWYDDTLSFMVQPEAVAFANPTAMMALPLDCVAASLREPVDKLFWAAGCWGSTYPYTGNVGNSALTINNSSLAAVRVMSLLARLQLMNRTMGNDTLCEPQKMKILTKSQYRFQMMFPVPESSSPPSGLNTHPPPDTGPTGDTTLGGRQVAQIDLKNLQGINKSCCHPIGMTTLKWGTWRSRPVTGEDQVYLVWQWIDCCLGKNVF